jgi:mannose-6-phosphate isomerase-like protein (cupin superfamily)
LFGIVTAILMKLSSCLTGCFASISGMAVHIGPGEMYVVGKGVEHKPFAEKEVKLMLVEPRGVLNTGDQGGERTADNDVWI